MGSLLPGDPEAESPWRTAHLYPQSREERGEDKEERKNTLPAHITLVSVKSSHFCSNSKERKKERQIEKDVNFKYLPTYACKLAETLGVSK